MNKATFSALRLGCGLAALLVLTLAGCGRRGEISGTVRFRGKPLPAGRITFSPQNRPGAAVFSLLGEDGSYKVTGCPAGPASITVQTVVSGKGRAGQDTRPGPGSRPAAAVIPVRYADPATSGLDYTVTPGEQQHDVDLQP